MKTTPNIILTALLFSLAVLPSYGHTLGEGAIELQGYQVRELSEIPGDKNMGICMQGGEVNGVMVTFFHAANDFQTKKDVNEVLSTRNIYIDPADHYFSMQSNHGRVFVKRMSYVDCEILGNGWTALTKGEYLKENLNLSFANSCVLTGEGHRYAEINFIPSNNRNKYRINEREYIESPGPYNSFKVSEKIYVKKMDVSECLQMTPARSWPRG
jgi:hypothetical protein